MTDELKQYADIAGLDIPADNGPALAQHLGDLAKASQRVGLLSIQIERALLEAERKHRNECLQLFPDAPQSKIESYVAAMTVEERLAFRESQMALKSLHKSFQATQSALSYLKAEMRM